MDFMVSATTTLCGHMFCERCIFEWNLFNKECPICRQPVRHEVPHPCPMMNSLIESYLDQSTMKKEKEAFLLRKRRIDLWKSNKTYFYLTTHIRVKNAQPGITLDVRDTEHIWCKGKVLKVISYANSPQVLLMHYEVRYFCLLRKFNRGGAQSMMSTCQTIRHDSLQTLSLQEEKTSQDTFSTGAEAVALPMLL